MTATEQRSVIQHRIGEHGRFSLKTVRGSVRIRALDGDEARVEGRYSSESDGRGRSEMDGALRIKRADAELSIEVDEAQLGVLGALGRLVGGGRPAIDFDVMLPRGTAILLSGVSAELEISGMAGDQEIRTVSGDARLEAVAGRLMLQSVSGDINVNGGAMSLDATTTSGRMDIVADRLDQLQLRSVSADLRVAGALAEDGRHTIELVSGDLELAPTNGVTVRMSSMSGVLRSNLDVRRSREQGRRTLVVGDGAAVLTFRTMSGDATVTGAVTADDSVPGGPSSRSGPPQPPRAPLAPAPPEPPTPPDPPRPPDAPRPLEASRPAQAPPSHDTSAISADEHMAVLRALERGEIDVDEATRRLEEGSRDA